MAISNVRIRESETWKEILSQGQVWQNVLQEIGRSASAEKILASRTQQKEWIFVGCGSSYYLAQAAANSWTLLTGQQARALPASEVLLFPQLVQSKDENAQAVVISRSGKTSETVRAAKTLSDDLGLTTIGLTCARSNELEQFCDATIVLQSADEKSMVMTRSFTSMLLSLQTLAARQAGNSQFVRDLQHMAEHFAARIPSIAEATEAFVEKHLFADYVFLGQGPFHGVAMEAALKVMEMSCSYSQFFHALEFRHGPKTIVSQGTCLMFFLSQTGREAEIEVLAEMKELGGVTIAVCNQADDSVRRASDVVVEVGFDGNELALLAPYAVAGQLLGFFTGVQKGLDADHPKNLTRVVILD
jgi:glucosamine--fructose-6-phosphate aminotransferase (isomerizing)